MKFRIDRDALADAVAWTARTLPVRPSVPVLAGMLLELDDTSLRLSGFDYEVSAQATIEADAEETGTALVSGRLIAEICRSLPPHPVNVTTDGTKVRVTCGSAKFTLLTMPVEDYPSIPELPPLAGHVGSDTFANAVSQVAIAAGRDDGLPVLTGVRMEIEGDKITLAATDRYRLAVREFTWKPKDPAVSAVWLVPAKSLADTAKSLTLGPEVAVAFGTPGETGDGMIGFEGGGRKSTTRLIDGDFPKYRALLPDEFSGWAEIQTAPLVEAVKRMSLVAERNTPVRLNFTADEVVLEAGTGDEAQAVEALPVTLEGDDIQIAFNHGYLLDGLSAIDSEIARINFTTSTKPAIITGKGADDVEVPDFRYLIMPIRLQ